MTTIPTTLDPAGWRALHSFTIDAILGQEADIQAGCLIRLGDVSAHSFFEAINRDDVQIRPLVIGDDLHLRVLIRGDDRHVGLCHPPAALLGVVPGSSTWQALIDSAEVHRAPDDLSGIDD